MDWQALSDEVRELLPPTIPRIKWDEPPHPLHFYRTYVATNTPVVLTSLPPSGPPHPSLATLLRTWPHLADAPVPIACTPNGLADAPVAHPPDHPLVFALPHERRATLADLATNLASAPPDDVWYLQPQNDSLRVAMPEPLCDALTHDALLGFGAAVFGAAPEAVNLWIGDARSSTSMHKDPYENLYHVLHGSKTFVLAPPCDVHRLNMQSLPVWQWQRDEGQADRQQLSTAPRYSLHPTSQSTPWCTLPLSGVPDPFVVTVHAGEALYLPSLWFHGVRQGARCDECGHRDVVAVNYWFDMQYDARYCYFKAIERSVMRG